MKIGGHETFRLKRGTQDYMQLQIVKKQLIDFVEVGYMRMEIRVEKRGILMKNGSSYFIDARDSKTNFE